MNRRLRLCTWIAVFAFVSVAAPTAEAAPPRELCVYQDADGKLQQVNSRDRVPVSLRESARCFSTQDHQYLAKPEEIELKGTTRREDMVSTVGRIELRWQRAVESLFGRTPQRAVADAARAVSRALKSAGFPPVLQNLSLEWKIVFMDENVPETQIPTYLVNNCHPAWMTPPANLYIVAQRAAAGCGGGQVRSNDADARLAHILIHEMGHAIEFQLLQGKMDGDRVRAEGFASWFEQYGSDFSSVIPKNSVRDMYQRAAQEALRRGGAGAAFGGTLEDYARASLYFSAVESRRGVRGIVDVYNTMLSENLAFPRALLRRMNWDDTRLETELLRAAGLP